MPFFTLKFSDDDPLFSMAFHPEKPFFLLGFASGRVNCYEYAEEGTDVEPQQVWTTKRHKGSCRALAYDPTGQFAVSCGSEGVVKKFDAQTGKVSKKTSLKAPASALAVNEEYIAIGDEEGNVSILKYDLSLHRFYELEDVESVSQVCALDIFNKHNFAVSADMHVFRIDARKDEVVSKSEDQEDDILCGCITSETRSAWGLSEGVLTVWKNKGLSDQQQRIKLTKEGSVDAVLAGEKADHAIAGTSDGWVAEVDLVSGHVLHKARHNPETDEDDIGYLDYDFQYRLVSASMNFLCVWNRDELEQVAAEEKAASEAKAAKKRSSNESELKQTDKKKKKKKSKSTNSSSEPSPFADLLG